VSDLVLGHWRGVSPDATGWFADLDEVSPDHVRDHRREPRDRRPDLALAGAVDPECAAAVGVSKIVTDDAVERDVRAPRSLVQSRQPSAYLGSTFAGIGWIRGCR
jgi:hypothetical protein